MKMAAPQIGAAPVQNRDEMGRNSAHLRYRRGRRVEISANILFPLVGDELHPFWHLAAKLRAKLGSDAGTYKNFCKHNLDTYNE